MMQSRFGAAPPSALLSRDEAREMDRRAIKGLGIPGSVLMENAARGTFEALLEHLPGRLGRVLVVGGPGNNGGDGWALCRHLRLAGFEPLGLLLGNPARLRGDARLNWEASRRMGIELHHASPEQGAGCIEKLSADASLLVDGVFGTGLDRPVQGGFAEALEAMGRASLPRVALDVPSGVCADTGRLLGPAPRCAMTVSFGVFKRGLWQHPGRAHAGRLVAVSIGAPVPTEPSAALFGVEEAARHISARAPEMHKGRAGRILVVAGSQGMGGAAVLAARGALRGGAGLVTVASRAAWAGRGVPGLPEAMCRPLPEGEAGAEVALREAERADVVVLGPGLGLDETAARIAVRLALSCPVPIVLDADALTAWAEQGLERLQEAPGPRWLTPHPGEAARLLRCRMQGVQEDRYEAARRLAARSGQTVVLKGPGTVVAPAGGKGTVYVCPRGTPALATGGTGDVLAGLCGALMASEGSDAEVAASAVLLHAIAGERAARGAERGLLAHEVAEELPLSFKELKVEP